MEFLCKNVILQGQFKDWVRKNCITLLAKLSKCLGGISLKNKVWNTVIASTFQTSVEGAEINPHDQNSTLTPSHSTMCTTVTGSPFLDKTCCKIAY